jgi:Peptidase_C39 like family
MVFRFWGDRHADVQQFESLVDSHAGGIADTALIDAIRARGWSARRLEGSLATIREQVEAGHPLILLIEDRPSRYHYVVAVGSDDQQVFIHDPTWGPARRLSVAELMRRWKPTGFWTLLVTAGNAIHPAAQHADSAARSHDHDLTVCDRLLNEALDKIAADGPGVADDVLETVSRTCPNENAPLRELAGIRFSQQRWGEAATLAERALDRNARDAYAWDVLGSSRFILDDADGALRAWNHIDKPTIDSVQISGLTRTRYAFVTRIAALAPNTLLTARQLSLADRRIHELPDRLAAAVAYRPGDDGFATVNVDFVERSRGPHSPVEWTALGVQAAVEREISVAMPGNTGQGELWEASWRWWSGRPRIAARFSAPRAGRLGGVWRVEGSWEAQTYAVQQNAARSGHVREKQAHGAISLSNWLTPNLRFDASMGMDGWDRGAGTGSGTLRTAFVSGTIERRLVADRVTVAGAATSWAPLRDGVSFRAASIRATARTSAVPTTVVALADIRAEFASATAPLAVWSGAGDGRARPGLLRAHPLLDDGVIEGPVFGRRVQSATLELQRWFRQPQLARIGIAVFADTASASDRLEAAAGRPFQVDVGSGLRFRFPGSDRTFRIDYAHGLRDRHAGAITVGMLNNF